MQLLQYDSYRPNKGAHFPHKSHPLLAVHPSDQWLAFQNRQKQIVLRNCSTGRNIVLGNSGGHLSTSITFMHDCLVATNEGSRDLLVYSLKTQKLKAKLTGHRSTITKVQYCRQSQLLISISHDLCVVHSEPTLTHIKTIKCSTSSFSDVGMSQDGGRVITSFKDGSVMVWEVADWSYRQSAVVGQSIKCAIGSQVVALYDGRRLWLADVKSQAIIFQQLLPQFWREETNTPQIKIEQVLFMDFLCLALRTTNGLYIVELSFKNNYKIKQVRSIATERIRAMAVSQYSSTLVLLTEKITWYKLQTSINQIVKSSQCNPLTNEGLLCAGGYSTDNHTCPNYTGVATNNLYSTAEHKVEGISEQAYSNIPSTFTLPKLKDFLRKHHILPDKYRPVAYRMALNLPVSPLTFKHLERQRPDKAIQLMEERYPIDNVYLASKMREVMALLINWQPIMGVADYIPSIVFPFVCLFGQDTLLCFQTLYRLFSSPLHFLFRQYPLANSSILQNMWQLLKVEDSQLTTHLERCSISFAKLTWNLLTTLFTSALGRQGVMAIADQILIRWDEPQLVLFMAIGYLSFNRGRLLSARSEEQALAVCEKEQTIHLPKYLSLVDKLQKRYRSKVRIEQLLKADLSTGQYYPLQYPKQAVKMAELKNKITLEQLSKHKEEQTNKQKMLQEIKKMTVTVRRQTERQKMQQEAYRMHCQEEVKQKIILREGHRQERIEAIGRMIEELTVALQGQKRGRQLLREYVPTVDILARNSQDDRELQIMEQRLLSLLAEVRPGSSSLRHLTSQPVNIVKTNKLCSNLNNAVRAKMAADLFQFDQLQRGNREVQYGNRAVQALGR